MKEYFRLTQRYDDGEIPSDIFYEVDDGRVIKLIEIDGDASFFWNNIESYENKQDIPGGNSLKEYTISLSKDFMQNEIKHGCFWQRIRAEDFSRWYVLAQKLGKRRYEIGVGTFVVSNA